MNSETYDYAARVREQQTREQQQAAALRIKVRGVARLLGGRYLEDDANRPSHTIELAPTMHLWARRDWKKKGMIHWGASCPKASGYSAPSVSTSINRPVAAVAEDLRRRLLPSARAWCKQTMDAAAQARDREHARRARLAEIEQILGTMRESHDHTHHHSEGFSIRHDDLLGSYRGEFRAEVTVRSWHCLLMIAKLVAEDARVPRVAASSPGEP
jgi:hypothetical protein